MLDACALVLTGLENICEPQARLTFAITRHAIVDLAAVFETPPCKPEKDRLPFHEFVSVRQVLAEVGLQRREGNEVELRLTELRDMYEPYVNSLSKYFHICIPSWLSEGRLDNWQTSKWDPLPAAEGTTFRTKEWNKHF